MTRRVNNSQDYQLPPGPLWWLCRYSDGEMVSEILFTSSEAQTWFQAHALMGRELGFKTPYKVTLHAPDN